MTATPRPLPDPDTVVTKATLRAAEMLGLNSAALAEVIGMSESSVSRLKADTKKISVKGKEGELALMLIRIFRSLDPLVGGVQEKRTAWMNSNNKALRGTPSQLIRKVDGLTRTLAYLDGMRAAT